jgi:hypothetical protein
LDLNIGVIYGILKATSISKPSARQKGKMQVPEPEAMLRQKIMIHIHLAAKVMDVKVASYV